MKASHHLLAAAIGTVALLSARPASGEGGETLQHWIELGAIGNVDRAVEGLRQAAADAGTAAARVAAAEALGRVYFDAGRQQEARSAFSSLLELDPGHRLGADSPRPLRRMFDQLQRRFSPTELVEIEVRAPPHLPRSRRVRIWAGVSGMVDGVDRAVLYHRPEGLGEFEQVPMDRAGPTSFECVLQVPEQGQALEYFVEVLAPSGAVLVATGTTRDALVIQPPPEGAEPGAADSGVEPLPEPRVPEPAATEVAGPEGGLADEGSLPVEPARRRRRWYQSWWFWTLVGVAVAGGTATAVVLTLPPTYEGGSLGLMHLP
jgi:hypothetical protein